MPLQRIPTTESLHATPDAFLIQESVCRRVGAKPPISGLASEDALAAPALLRILVKGTLMGLEMALEVGQPRVRLHPTAHTTDKVGGLVHGFDGLDVGGRRLDVTRRWGEARAFIGALGGHTGGRRGRYAPEGGEGGATNALSGIEARRWHVLVVGRVRCAFGVGIAIGIVIGSWGVNALSLATPEDRGRRDAGRRRIARNRLARLEGLGDDGRLLATRYKWGVVVYPEELVRIMFKEETRRAHTTESAQVAFKSIGSTSESESKMLSLSESESLSLSKGGEGEGV